MPGVHYDAVGIAVIVAYTVMAIHALPDVVQHEATRIPSKDVKKILTWNDFFGMKHFGASLGNATFQGCKVSNCELWDRLDQEPDLPHEEYDAVVFHGIDTSNSSLDDLPQFQTSKQRYIFVLQESPIMRPVIYGFKDYFNWTATYRRDSDIHLSFVDVQKIDRSGDTDKVRVWREPTFEDMTHIPDFVMNKTKLVAWFVSNSNAQSKRDLYVEELSKHIQVDVYGHGRALSCDHKDANCDLMLDTTYKFYLAFENSLCVDYVTEKLNRAVRHHVVPVVYGGADYNAFAPPHSYINTKDFASPKQLARYLLYLDSNPREYLKYFWWKKFYQQTGRIMWCDICEKLNDPAAPNRVYANMESWWNAPKMCQSPEDHFGRSFYTSLYMIYPDTKPWWIQNNTCPKPRVSEKKSRLTPYHIVKEDSATLFLSYINTNSYICKSNRSILVLNEDKTTVK